MLLKIMGSIFIIAASSYLGFIFAGQCAGRPQQLRELQSLLQMLENEISYLSSVLSEAFEKIAGYGSKSIAPIFRDAAENIKSGNGNTAADIWEKAVKVNIGATALNGEDKQVLLSFGKMLGSSDLEGQIKNIRMTLTQLKLQEQKAEENRSKNEKMYKTLGILGGLAIVIILI